MVATEESTAPASVERPITLIVAVALIAAVIAAAAAWFWPRYPAANSPEVAFARDMSAHHEQAVQIALIIRDRTSDEQLRLMATDMTLTQQNQIGQMSAWLTLWNQPLTGPEPPMAGMAAAMGMATQAEINELSSLDVTAAEIKFLQLMIRHHQGGVYMAEDVLKTNPHPAVTRLAESIVAAQQSEIDAMSQFLAARGAELPEPLPRMEH